MSHFNIPNRTDMSDMNQKIYDRVNKELGFVPNLYKYLTNHNTALSDYLAFIGRKSSLSAKEKELISLVVSQFNECLYCLSAHTALGKLVGFTEKQTFEIR